MSNNYSINTAGINSNSSGLSVVVGVLAAAILAVTSTQTMANVIAGSSSTGTISTVVIAQANQIHKVSCSSGVLPVTGSGTAVRMAGYIPKVDNLSTYGSTVTSFLYAYGGSGVELRTSGTVTPNYFVAPPSLVTGVLDTAIQVNPLRLSTANTTDGYVSLSGYFVVPNIVSVIDIYMSVQLDGYCISANELGHGYGNLDVTVTCQAIRVVPIVTSVVLWGDGPKLITNDAGYYSGNGNVTTSGVTNVNIKASGTNYYTWYYENWLTLDSGTGSCKVLVYKNISTPIGAIPKLDVVVTADGIRQATAILNPIEVKITGILDNEKRAGIISRMGYLRTSDVYPLNYEVHKSPSVEAVLSTTGTTEGIIIQSCSSIGSVTTTSGDGVYWDRITPVNIASGVLDSAGSASGIRIVVLDNNIGNIVPDVNITCLVYKNISSNGIITTTGAVNAEVMFITNTTYIGTGGFCIGEHIHASSPSDGTLYTTCVLFDVVNLYVKADETRQMVVAPSPNRVGDIQNYIKVVI